MPAIGIIDDREDPRNTLKNFISLHISSEWEIIAEPPLPYIQDYSSWILRSDIAILVLDERLREANIKQKISYDGHDVVDYIRKTLHTLPIFVVTAFPNDSEIVRRFPDVEEILSRDEFTDPQKDYIPRLLRSAQKFREVFQEELKTLGLKADKIARGRATKKDIDELRAIQTKINTSFPIESFQSQNEWLKLMEEQILELEKIYKKTEKFLKKKR